MADNCLFCKIIRKEITAEILYEDDEILVFNDINPQSPVHFLVIPKKHIPTINAVKDPQLIGKLHLTASRIAKEQGFAENGYRLVINCNQDGGQTVFHLHLHCLAKRRLSWPPG